MGIFCIPTLVIVSALCSGALGDRSHETGKIESPRLTNWGSWSEWSYCPDGKFVIGFKLKVDPRNSRDKSAINAIRLICAAPMSDQYSELKNNIESPWGVFASLFSCEFNSFVKGFTLRSEEDKGSGVDDTGANNLRIRCDDGEIVEGDGWERGSWTKEQICVEGSVVCGFRTQHEEDHIGDNAALNNVDMACCSRALERTSTSTTPRPTTPTSTTPTSTASTSVYRPLIMLTTSTLLILAKTSLL